MTPSAAAFRGFAKPTYTQIPNELFDILLPILSLAEFKVVMFICRQTLGWHVEHAPISLITISESCQLSKQGVIASLDSLIAQNVIYKIKPEASGPGQKNEYGLKFKEDGTTVNPVDPSGGRRVNSAPPSAGKRVNPGDPYASASLYINKEEFKETSLLPQTPIPEHTTQSLSEVAETLTHRFHSMKGGKGVGSAGKKLITDRLEKAWGTWEPDQILFQFEAWTAELYVSGFWKGLKDSRHRINSFFSFLRQSDLPLPVPQVQSERPTPPPSATPVPQLNGGAPKALPICPDPHIFMDMWNELVPSAQANKLGRSKMKPTEPMSDDEFIDSFDLICDAAEEVHGQIGESASWLTFDWVIKAPRDSGLPNWAKLLTPSFRSTLYGLHGRRESISNAPHPSAIL